ncbi:MAG: DUF309 domain-containing protein, partial [Cyanobacteria bacterium P01_H01_bin.121]
ACHDTLEALWMEALEPERSFYQGILQIAVSLYHLSHCNWQGAVTLMGSGLGRLDAYCPDYEGVDVAQLVEESQSVLTYLQVQGPEQVSECARSLGFAVASPGELNNIAGIEAASLPILPTIAQLSTS